MFRRSLKWIFARHVMADACRLIRSHGFRALFIAQKASSAAGETSLGDHWSRVRREIEVRSNYRPW